MNPSGPPAAARSPRSSLLVAAVPLAALSLAAGWVSAQTKATPRLLGFSTAATIAELQRERDFKAMLSARRNEADFDVMTAEPHHVGSPYDARLADWVSQAFAADGLEVARHEYRVLIPWPGERRIDITTPDHLSLPLEEEAIAGDPWAAKPGILPAFNAYSPSGDVAGPVVYVNFGVPADYDTLKRLGIDVTGKIVLARYGGSWRGIKPKVAAEHGAIGCIIYSDPHEDGYYAGDVYPQGPYRGWGMIQRGSVVDMPRYPGDPATPGRPSTPGVERLPLASIDILARIPVQPLAYRDAVEILKRLGGPVAPVDWRGALPATYHVGPGPAAVHMMLRMDYAERPVVDVIGRLTGGERRDEWIIVGAHRDAWVFGAADNASGHVPVMAVARALGAMAAKGWRPKRTILFASWDGEEPGLLGSTEWAEDLAADLQAHAAVYVNLDPGAAGPFFASSAVHSLTPFVHELARAIDSDRPPATLYDRWLERQREQDHGVRGRMPIGQPRVGALGSGSDYTAFLDHLGVTSMDMGLTGPGTSGTYHSIYDNAAWFRKFIDPHFAFSVIGSQVTGVAALRLADAELLPFDFDAYGKQIGEYVDEIQRQAGTLAEARRVDFAGLKAAAAAFARAGAQLRERGDALVGAAADPARLEALDRAMIAAERDLLEPAGLPDRPWYRHTIYAPGLYTGYGVKTIPGVREAIDARNFARAAEQADIVVRALGRAADTLSAASR